MATMFSSQAKAQQQSETLADSKKKKKYIFKISNGVHSLMSRDVSYNQVKLITFI